MPKEKKDLVTKLYITSQYMGIREKHIVGATNNVVIGKQKKLVI
jgi:hypothetical protein